MNEFTYQIVSDGPHRADQIFLVVGGALFVSGQLSFGDKMRDLAGGEEPAPPDEDLPPLQFVFERKMPAEA